MTGSKRFSQYSVIFSPKLANISYDVMLCVQSAVYSNGQVCIKHLPYLSPRHFQASDVSRLAN